MKFFKKLMRLIALIFLMLLATVGVGLSGGIPMPSSGRKENTIEVKTEVEEEEEESPDQQIKPQ
ncbi:hypothetical protein [Pedobacter sp. Hv1]|uniref:hypothetical protein n=1 Tax=Pedobacter sp. Hv1 TaxID=1740090 RepID=UPI0006E5D162|nr:hypothetical protein [Pedobacter sp. Hv1]KQB99748.1 hypothetical protein AQF98_14585 [Pedobacter sp. Hv1]